MLLRLETYTDSISRDHYPPPMFTKHHRWYFENADLFIIIRGIVYGLHQIKFLTSTYFQTILSINEINEDQPQGTTCLRPIPFDDMSHADFSLLLYFLYCPYNFQGTERDWKVIQ